MIKDLCAIIDNRRDIWIIVSIVVIKGVEENSQASPLIWAAKNSAIVGTFALCIPKCQAIRSYSSPTTYSKY